MKRGPLILEVWGARGSLPTAEANKLRHGGNTTCISVLAGNGQRLVFDAGTGARNLGRKLAGMPESQIDFFFTHFHWDHIQGLPYFSPLFENGKHIVFHSGIAPEETRARLERQMSYPYFPFNFEAAKSHREFKQLGAAGVTCDGVRVQIFPMNHPQGAWGYRIESEGAAVVIATDMEHGNPALDKVLLEHASNADLLIYDAQYTESEYASHVGWGHSNPREAAAMASAANVKQLMLFHHDPDHDDDTMDKIVRETRSLFPATCAAQEGRYEIGSAPFEPI